MRLRAARFALLALLLPGPALAQATGLELSWQAPPACPTEAAIRRQVDVLVAAPADESTALRPLAVTAVIEQTSEGFRLKLELRDGELVGKRTFVGASCAEVAGAAAVAIALLMRPPEDGSPGAEAPSPTSGGAATTTAQESNTAESGTLEAPEKAHEDAVKPASSTAHQVHFVVLGPSVDIGFQLFSQPSPGLGVGLGLEPFGWRVAISGTWHPELRLPSEVVGVYAQVQRLTASLQACRWFAPSRLELAPCLSASVQIMGAQGNGSGVLPEREELAWFALGPAGLARFRLGQVFALTGKVALEFQTTRAFLFIDPLYPLERIGPLELNAALGAEWIF